MSILDFVCLGQKNPEQIEAFAPLIPAQLVPRMKAGELLGLGSVLGDMPNGAAVFETDGAAAWLHSLYVYEYDRRHGTGSELIEELSEKLRLLGGIYSLEACLPDSCSDGVRLFFEKNGFELYQSRKAKSVCSLAELAALSLPAAKVKCLSGDEMDASLLRNLENELKKKSLYLLEGSLSEAPVLGGLCRYAVEDGRISAAAVVTKTPDGFSLAYLYGENGAAVSSVLSAAKEAVLGAMGEGDLLHMELVNDSSERLAEKLLGAERLQTKSFIRKTI